MPNIVKPILVTASFAVGHWLRKNLTYEQYVESILSLNNKMVIFTDSQGSKFIESKRRMNETEVGEQFFAIKMKKS